MNQQEFQAAMAVPGWRPRPDLVPVIAAAQHYAKQLQTTPTPNQAEADLRQAEAGLMYELALALGRLP